MKKLILFITAAVLSVTISTGQSSSKAQPMSEQSIKPFVYHFTHEQGKINGPGSAIILQYLSSAQFFAFGEYHGSHQITTLSKTLLEEAHKNGYQNFAVEVGPNSAKVLQRMAQDPQQVMDQLYAFNSKYYLPEDEDIPIPFFDGKEDAELLATSSRLGFNLWGLDQEFFTAPFFLFDEMVSLANNNQELQKLRQQIEPTLKRLYSKDVNQKRFPLYDSLQSDPNIILLMDKAVKINPKCKEIVESLKISWDIYERNRQYSRSSHYTRINYMRDNFSKNYEALQNKQAKVFLKMGGVHTAKDKSLGAYDIGELLQKIAIENGTMSISTSCTSRFEKRDDGTIKDYWLDRKDKFITFAFRMFGKKEAWTVIDLKAIKAKVEAGELVLPTDYTYHSVRSILNNYDLYFIPPIDKETAPNYEVKTQ